MFHRWRSAGSTLFWVYRSTRILGVHNTIKFHGWLGAYMSFCLRFCGYTCRPGQSGPSKIKCVIAFLSISVYSCVQVPVCVLCVCVCACACTCMFGLRIISTTRFCTLWILKCDYYYIIFVLFGLLWQWITLRSLCSYQDVKIYLLTCVLLWISLKEADYTEVV